MTEEEDWIVQQARSCNHSNFHAQCEIRNRAGLGRFQFITHVRCTGCGVSFRFLGLPPVDPSDPDGIGTDDEGFICVIPISPRYGPMAGLAEQFLSAETSAIRMVRDMSQFSERDRVAVFAALTAAYCPNCGKPGPGDGTRCGHCGGLIAEQLPLPEPEPDEMDTDPDPM